MWDSHQRQFTYLRLSITDACNFRCVYCLPQGYNPGNKKKPIPPLSLREITHLVTAFAELGMSKIRITGGEPTLRRDLPAIVRAIAALPGVQKVALSTNGYRLQSILPVLRHAGLTHLNVSIDSLDPRRFAKLTGKNLLPEVLAGIEVALATGFAQVKVNAVLLQEWDEQEFHFFEDWVRQRPVLVRFIELMPTRQNGFLQDGRRLSGAEMQTQLLNRGWFRQARKEGDGPAVEYRHPDFVGGFGIIAPYSPGFCSTCNRLRITSQGELRLCLFAEGNHSVRHLLQEAAQKDALQELLQNLLQKKESSHYLPLGRLGDTQTFSAMGG